MSEDFVVKEQKRQLLISKAVETAEYVLNDAGETDPDVKAYLWYKTGAQLLLKGLAEGIDKRVMLSDMGLTALVELKIPEPILNDVKLCGCGRPLWLDQEVTDSTEPFEACAVCSGCFNLPSICDCKKLAGQLKP